RGDLTFLKSAADVASVALASARVAARYRHIVTTMTEGVVVGDSQRKIVFVNPAASAFFGHPADELIGKSVDTLWFDEDRAQRNARYADLEAHGAPRRDTLRYR